jgi:hypothetical protein
LMLVVRLIRSLRLSRLGRSSRLRRNRGTRLKSRRRGHLRLNDVGSTKLAQRGRTLRLSRRSARVPYRWRWDRSWGRAGARCCDSGLPYLRRLPVHFCRQSLLIGRGHTHQLWLGLVSGIVGGRNRWVSRNQLCRGRCWCRDRRRNKRRHKRRTRY